MRRIPWQLSAAVVLLVLLATLATFQYRWLGEVSEAERERMRAGLRTRATEFSQEFDRELTRIYLAFHFDRDAFQRDPAGALADALATAQASSTAPGLVRDAFLLDAQGLHPGALQRVDSTRRVLEPTNWPEPLESWRRRAEISASLPSGLPSPFFMSDAVDATTPALVIPIPRITRFESGGRLTMTSDSAETARVVLVWLDGDHLQQQLLEPLIAKYFGAGNASEYLVSVVQRDDPAHVVYASATDAAVDGQHADVSTGLFDLRMDEVNRLALSSAPHRGPGPGTERMAITIVRRARGGDGSHVSMAGGDNQGAWLVRVRHRSGSLDAIVAQSRRRNMAISVGVLGLLGAAFVLVMAGAHRQQRLSRQQMEFVASVSHELRTPLAVICSAGENLADGVVSDGPQVKRYGSLIETEGRRLGDMVERVLEFAGISSGKAERPRVDVDVSTVIRDAVNGVSHDARERGVKVTVNADDALPRVTGDADGLRSAVQNIVGNAVKYSPDGAMVEVRTDVVHDSRVRIRVTDRGLGIDPSDLPHIFKPFYRGRRALDAQVRGTGVGLSVVRHVIAAHQGRVAVESRAGEGTTVIVTLPA